MFFWREYSKSISVNKKKGGDMPEKPQSNSFIDAIDWELMGAFMNLRAAGLFAGTEAVRSIVEHDDDYLDVSDCHDVDPTTQLFV